MVTNLIVPAPSGSDALVLRSARTIQPFVDCAASEMMANDACTSVEAVRFTDASCSRSYHPTRRVAPRKPRASARTLAVQRRDVGLDDLHDEVFARLAGLRIPRRAVGGIVGNDTNA